jgi:hypothetical protein
MREKFGTTEVHNGWTLFHCSTATIALERKYGYSARENGPATLPCLTHQAGVLVRTAPCTKVKDVFRVLTTWQAGARGTTASCYGYKMVMPSLLGSEVGAMCCHCRSKVVNNVVGLSGSGPHEKEIKIRAARETCSLGVPGSLGIYAQGCAGSRPPGGLWVP